MLAELSTLLAPMERVSLSLFVEKELRADDSPVLSLRAMETELRAEVTLSLDMGREMLRPTLESEEVEGVLRTPSPPSSPLLLPLTVRAMLKLLGGALPRTFALRRLKISERNDGPGEGARIEGSETVLLDARAPRLAVGVRRCK